MDIVKNKVLTQYICSQFYSVKSLNTMITIIGSEYGWVYGK